MQTTAPVEVPEPLVQASACISAPGCNVFPVRFCPDAAAWRERSARSQMEAARG
jgi:hypothetical protein